MLSKKLAAIAAVSLITASSAAVAQSAPSQSPTVERASADTSGQNSLDRRGYGIYIVGAIVLGLIIWGIIELTKDDNPHSP